jgi:AraC family transcriptional regulator
MCKEYGEEGVRVLNEMGLAGTKRANHAGESCVLQEMMTTLEIGNGVRAREARYDPWSRIAGHAHPWAYIACVLDGIVAERCAGVEDVRGRGAVRIMPADVVHANSYSVAGARCFVTELHTGADEALVTTGALHDIALHAPGSPVSLLAGRMHAEYRHADDLSALAVDGLLRELLVAATRAKRSHASELGVPLWLRRVRDRMHDEFPRATTLADLAAEAGVSISHLLRSFRKHYHRAPAAYVAHLRVEHARRALITTDWPITRIALDAGFSDQAHLTRRFREHVGLTPARYRALTRS